MAEIISLCVDGQTVRVPTGTTVAVAAMIAGATTFRRSVLGQPRGPLCGMGICFECRLTIDGKPHRRSCQVEGRDGMVVTTT